MNPRPRERRKQIPGMPARELAERMGHSKASMSLDVYTHEMPPDEAEPAAVAALLS